MATPGDGKSEKNAPLRAAPTQIESGEAASVFMIIATDRPEGEKEASPMLAPRVVETVPRLNRVRFRREKTQRLSVEATGSLILISSRSPFGETSVRP